MARDCEHGQLKRSCPLCEKDAEIERLREALRLSTNGLRHCSRWNISEETEKAIITQVIANELLLTTNDQGNKPPTTGN